MFWREIADRKKLLVSGRRTPRLDVVTASDQSAHVIVKRPLASAARQVVPHSDSHNLTVAVPALFKAT